MSYPLSDVIVSRSQCQVNIFQAYHYPIQFSIIYAAERQHTLSDIFEIFKQKQPARTLHEGSIQTTTTTRKERKKEKRLLHVSMNLHVAVVVLLANVMQVDE
ncbi:CLUMA_CG008344, isoform A [Clunio marinus]|uniref:CLUMA_CG008344, isoform A n=1 Tax=Clunio marinus TaxID=568069 RepID=A0A1J1I5I7_9DIPT|nr:CLUMA_CG008344, isoform A [Clunio marinus]